MPVVLIHGNPETDAIWDDVRAHLGREAVVTLSPPGFGAPVPDGFDPTSDGYVRWLEGELKSLSGPIDLATVRPDTVFLAACQRPDLIRSWTTDIAGCFDPDYVWHDLARVWQTPGAGEDAVARMVAAPLEERAKRFESLGMTPDVARRVAAANNAEMGRCILRLYRSAAQPAMKIWGEELPKAAVRPGLVIIATEDHFTGGEVLARRSAERAGAKVAVLERLGHWWMCQDPAGGAAVLREFLEDQR